MTVKTLYRFVDEKFQEGEVFLEVICDYKIICMTFSENDTILEVKEKIAEVARRSENSKMILPDCQRLYKDSRRMSNRRTLASYGINPITSSQMEPKTISLKFKRCAFMKVLECYIIWDDFFTYESK
ncbi:uncharacterized protein LOC129959103 [Argiope bruennichi]|uniref:uncharacterized protein LOC129959103 n=1 Tax=Argiope bruennichi TaxID=94029 RepID=UPI0024949084|nr:uncharacterized protein LOC129959103 [Argiope bruennichi]